MDTIWLGQIMDDKNQFVKSLGISSRTSFLTVRGWRCIGSHPWLE